MTWIRIWMCDSYHDWNSNWSNILAPDMLTDLVIWSWWVCDPQWQLCIAFWYPDYVTNLFLMILWCTMTAKYCILISWLCDRSTAFWYPNYLTNVLHSDVPTIWSKYRILISRLCDQSTAFWYPDYVTKVLHSDILTILVICSWSVCDPQPHWCTTLLTMRPTG
jgi:hypothetical protein